MTLIVLDTNVLINADRGEFSHGKRLVGLVQRGKVRAVTSHAVRRENELIIGRLVHDQRLKAELKTYLELAEEVAPAQVQVSLEDSEDVKLLAAAVGGAAQFLITDDRHLLQVEEYRGVRVVTPAQFWQWWQATQDEAGETWGSWAANLFGQR